jgi:hypothetical protein
MAWYGNSAGRHGLTGAIGDKGELIVEIFCKATNRKWEDRNDYHSQVKLKIDCIIDGVAVDVKANAKGDYLVAEISTVKKGRGWLFETTAEEIYGVDIKNREIYRYNVSDMIEHLKTNRDLIRDYNGDRLAYVPKDADFIERLL